MYVRVLKCFREEFVGRIMFAHFKWANGMEFITDRGRLFLPDGDFEAVSVEEYKKEVAG